MQDTRKAVVLLSGGIDSATTLAEAEAAGFGSHVLTFAYGQKQIAELKAAERVCAHLRVKEHRLITIDLAAFGGSALTSGGLAVPKDEELHAITGQIPITYVPARNTIFLAYALAYAEVLGAFDIFIGANFVDYSGYPDCRPEYLAAYETLANLATKAAVQGTGKFKIQAPLLYLSKKEIILRGVALGVDYSLTHSCYDPVGELACGHCASCDIRREGFRAAGVSDPTRYVK